MYILKNAITSIKRNKGRNLLIGLIIIIIASAVTVTLAINNTAASLIKAYKDKYQVEASITFNRENMMKDFNPNDRENSKMILADEPTGNLDKDTENEILKIFKDLAHKDNKCIIIVTHSENVCNQADKVYELTNIKKS